MISNDIVATKSFGDLAITLTVLRGASATMDIRLLLGEHLVPLAHALGVHVPTVVIAHGEKGVPAMYDVRRCGAQAAIRSAWHLRRLIHAADPRALLFDRIGVRERWLSGRAHARSLPAADNIYAAYGEAFGGSISLPPTRALANDSVGIFPGSRLPAKNLPASIIGEAIARITGAGLSPRLLLLEGERPDLERSGLQHEVVPRSFAAMIAAVEGCGLVISADSMPAHIAESLRIPVFVLSPVENRYWLPRSAFVANHWMLFGDDFSRLNQFLHLPEKKKP